MRDWQREDRRKFPRIAVEDLISFAPIDEKDRLAVGKDLSEGGIRFEVVGCEIELDDVIRVTFTVADQTFIGIGRVAWATELDAITLDVGLEFLDIDPLARQFLDTVLAKG